MIDCKVLQIIQSRWISAAARTRIRKENLKNKDKQKASKAVFEKNLNVPC